MADLQRAQHIQIQNRWLKVIPPAQETNDRPAVILCLHGWTGDEHSMDVFVRRLPDTCWILAPRAPLSAPQGGYTWVPPTAVRPAPWPVFAETAQQLEKDLQIWFAHLALPQQPLTILGFSQGAAMALTYTVLYPEQINRVVALSGFLPEGAKAALQNNRLSGKTIFIAHGTHDEMVPVARAHESAELLKSAGADVVLCLEDTGHRTGMRCLQAMMEYLKALK